MKIINFNKNNNNYSNKKLQINKYNNNSKMKKFKVIIIFLIKM